MYHHRRILQENRVYLVNHLDLKNTGILDHLVQEEVLSPDQLGAMRDIYQTNTELASELVRHLERRPYEDWKKFLSCLRDHGLGNIEESIGRALQKDVPFERSARITKEMQRVVAMAILRDFDRLELWDWEDDTVSIKLDDLYTELIYAKTAHTTQGSMEKQLLTYTDMLSKKDRDGQPIRVYLEGVAGTGKTTLVKRLIVDWARHVTNGWWKRIFRTPRQVKKLRRYKLVLPVFLRDVSQGQSLAEAVLENIDIQKEVRTIETILANNQELILVIMDGLDEFREHTSSHLIKILEREKMTQLDLLITSRNHPSLHFRTTKQRPTAHIILKGFSDKSVDTYIRSFFPDKTDGDSLRNEICKSEYRKELSRYPAVLLLMCVVWRDQNRIAETESEFYSDFVKYVCSRFERKFVRKHRLPVPQNILDKYHRYIMEIGNIAVNGLMGDKLELSFHVSVLNGVTDIAKQLGLINTRKKVSFHHKTLQEYLGAYYIINCEPARRQELFLYFVSSPNALKESTKIVTFLKGLGKETVTSIIRTIIEGSQDDIAKTQTAVQLSYLSETPTGIFLLPKMIEFEFSKFYTPDVLTRYFSMDSSGVEMITIWAPSIKQLLYLKNLQSPELNSVIMWQRDTGFVDGFGVGKIEQIRSGQQPVKIKTLILKEPERFPSNDIVWLYNMTDEHTRVTFRGEHGYIIVRSRQSKQQVRHDFAFNEILVNISFFEPDHLSKWFPSNCIKSVSVTCTEEDTFKDILFILRCLSHIEELSLHGHIYMMDVVPIVTSNTKLEKLELFGTGMCLEAFFVLGEKIGKLSKLKEFRISHTTKIPEPCKDTCRDTGGEFIEARIKRKVHHKPLLVRPKPKCDLPDIAYHICRGLKHNACLEILDLSQIIFNRDAYQALAGHQFPSLRVLKLGKCVDLNSMGPLMDNIQHNSRNLSVLDVSRGLVSVDVQQKTAECIKNLMGLKELRVCRCDIKNGIHSVVENIRHTSSVEILDLSGNMSNPEVHEILDVRSVISSNTVTAKVNERLASNIKTLPTLRELHLCECDDPRGLIPVINSLRFVTELHALDLSGNNADPEMYSSLKEQLSDQNNLQVLRLCVCKEINVVKHVVKILHHMRGLQVLDLSGVKAKRSKRFVYSELFDIVNCVTDDVYQELGNQLPHMTRLLELRLCHCGTVDAVRPVFAGLHRTPELHTLDLMGNEASSDVFSELGKNMKNLRKLRELRLFFSEDRNAVRSIVQNLHHTPGLTVLDLSGKTNFRMQRGVPFVKTNTGDRSVFAKLSRQLQYLPRLQELRLCGCCSDQTGEAVAVVDALQYSPCLQVLDIGRWSLDAAGMELLGARLVNLRELRQLLLGNCDTCGIWHVYRNAIINDVQMHMAWSSCFIRIVNVSLLQVLDVSNNNIGNNGVEQLSEQLPSLTQLDQLYMERCGLTEIEAVLQLINTLKLCPSLRILYLSENDLGDELVVILAMTQQLSGLHMLNLEYNVMSESVMNIIKKRFKLRLPDLILKV